MPGIRLTKSQYWEIVEVPRMTSEEIEKELTALLEREMSEDDLPSTIETASLIQRLETEKTIRKMGLRVRETEELEKLLLVTTDPSLRGVIDFELNIRWVINMG